MTTPANESRSRTLVLCFDGTGDRFDDSPTNVVRLFSLLDKSNPDKQLVYYQPGIGTYVSPGIGSAVVARVGKILDQGVAMFLDAHIMGGYSFLMENWKEGDKICLFGFSRGAYTARCLAGMLHKVGLLAKSNTEQVPFAYSLYSDKSPEGKVRSKAFKYTFSNVVHIEFVGCWDTVSSVGALWPRHLPFTSSNHVVKTFRHALALDEHRSKFKANSWHHTAPDAEAAAHDPECGSPIKNQPETNIFTKAWQQTERIWDRAVEEVSEATVRQFQPDTIWSDEGASTRQATQDEEYPGRPKTDILEVWFSGCHADVGGGSVDDSVVYSLANPPLRWMIKETIARGAGIQYKELPLISFGVDPTSGRSTIRSNTINSRRDPFTGLRIQPLSDETALTISDSPVEGITSAARGPVPTEATNPDSSLIKRLGFKQKSSFKEDAGDAKHADGKSSMYSSSFDDTADKALEQQRKELPDYHDAVSPLYDQLKISPIWYLLEILPIRQNYQDHTGEWHRRWIPNFSRGRVIHNKGHPLYFHSSVKLRMESVKGYKPRAKYSGEPIWVD